MFSLFTQTANAAGCPFGHDQEPVRIPAGQNSRVNGRVAPEGYLEAFAKLDLDAVRKDIEDALTDSKPFFPADYDNYGPLMIRLAWHSAGSYRIRDGRGGADGARMRFEPERSWDDNTNLDKARTLLEPIKKKYGVGLSWGDLIVLAGDTAIKSMGGPIVGFCGGRIDDNSGFWSERLGPSALQRDVEPFVDADNDGLGDFQAAVEPGFVYVNPEGPLINGQRVRTAEASAVNVRETFRRMGMNDTETVALVGGGHAFGKAHRACAAGPGESPANDPENPWPGLCGTGNGPDTATSAWEGPWTTVPYQWDNEYFKNILDYQWQTVISPGFASEGDGPMQWEIVDPAVRSRMQAPNVDGVGSQNIMMFTADLALTAPIYKDISMDYRNNQAKLDKAFSEAWYKLMTRDMGPVTRCLNEDVPEPRAFQNPLPAPPAQLADFEKVKMRIKEVMKPETAPAGVVLTPGADVFNGKTNFGPLFTRLAWRCAATHRVTDYTGGCDGARIRMEPQTSWPINAGLNEALDLLEPIKNEFGDALSWADLIVLAGTTSLEEAGAPAMPFCGGRTDATHGDGGVMPPRLNEDFSNDLDDLQETALLMGLTPREFTALQGRRSIGAHFPARGGFRGKSDFTPMMLDNGYFNALLKEEWKEYTVQSTGKKQYMAEKSDLFMLRSDLLLTFEPEFLTHAQDFASDNDVFLKEFASAWTKVMNADRYDGPTGNLCEPFDAMDKPMVGGTNMTDREQGLVIVILVLAVTLILTCLVGLIKCCMGKANDSPHTGSKIEMGNQGQQSPRGQNRL